MRTGAVVFLAAIAAVTVCYVHKKKSEVPKTVAGVALANIEMISAADDKSKQLEEEMDTKI